MASYNFKGQNAIITGACKGIGKEICHQLLKDGANVLMLDINEEGLVNAVNDLSEFKSQIEYKVLDISNQDIVNDVVNEYISNHSKIDILINNASIYHIHSGFLKGDMNEFHNKVNVNVFGTVYMCKAVVDNMISNNYGRIINIASVAGVYGDGGMVDYATTKGAIIAFTKSLAKEISKYGVTVNAVSPGSIDVGSGNLPELSFIGRSGSVEECANLVTFLCSVEASYISGQNYQVDGCRKKM